VSIVLYTCGVPPPGDWVEALKKRYNSWLNFYEEAAEEALYYDDTLKQKEILSLKRLSPECPKGKDYAWFAMAVFLSNGQCRFSVMHPQAPNFIEEYGPCPSDIKPPEEAKQML
jgi:hypothetical protein